MFTPGRLARAAKPRHFTSFRQSNFSSLENMPETNGDKGCIIVRHIPIRQRTMPIRSRLNCRSELLRPRLIASLYLLSVLVAHSVAAQTPTIRLFPTNVVENVKESGRVARDMENSLQSSIADLELLWRLYRESKCEGAEGDPGCDQIAKQFGDTYLEMLLLMDASLPRMQASVQITVNSLEKLLRTELGLKMTARDLQQLFADQSPDGGGSDPNRNTQRIGRLSERFRQYYQLVAPSQARAQGSMALVAAEIYLDGKEVLELIALTQVEITRSRVMIEMHNEFGELTPKLNDVLNGVKSILFGEEDLGMRGN